jgi:MFS family permease
MRVRERTAVLTQAELDDVLAPRTLVVTEAVDAPGVFSAVDGPVRAYRRTVTFTTEADGTHRVTQRVDMQPNVPFWGWLFGPLLRSHLRKFGRAADESPFWYPPDRLDQQATTALSRLGAIAFVLGYQATLLTQTITYAAGEFGADKGAQGVALAATRLDVLLSIPLAFLADRRGRRQLVVYGAVVACVLTALGALSPNLSMLAVTQVLAGGVTSGAAIALGVMIAEDMPAGARAWATSLMAMAGFFGGGMCVILLPLADVSDGAWRLLYVVPVALIPLTLRAARGLVETHRFRLHVEANKVRARAVDIMRTHRRRFALLAASAALINVFAVPASEFQNEFLRNSRGFSGAQITLFLAVTSLPGGIGIVVGGRLAERGRRLVGAVATFVGVGATMLMFFSSGVGLYAWSALGSTMGAAAVPALGVYGAELFPTEARGAANAGLGLIGRIGSVTGLIIAGEFGDRIGLPRTFLWLGIGPLILTMLILVAYPETAHHTLEDLNPEDKPL